MYTYKLRYDADLVWPTAAYDDTADDEVGESFVPAGTTITSCTSTVQANPAGDGGNVLTISVGLPANIAATDFVVVDIMPNLDLYSGLSGSTPTTFTTNLDSIYPSGPLNEFECYTTATVATANTCYITPGKADTVPKAKLNPIRVVLAPSAAISSPLLLKIPIKANPTIATAADGLVVDFLLRVVGSNFEMPEFTKAATNPYDSRIIAKFSSVL